MPNFYAVLSMLLANEISVNLLAQKLLIERWWNWHLVEVGVAEVCKFDTDEPVDKGLDPLVDVIQGKLVGLDQVRWKWQTNVAKSKNWR